MTYTNILKSSEELSLEHIKKLGHIFLDLADYNLARIVVTLLIQNTEKYDDALNTLISFGIPNDPAHYILDYSIKTGNFECFTNYIQNRTLTLEQLSKSNNIISVVKTIIPGITDEFILWLINYSWPSTPSTGAGEAALIIFLKDGKKPEKGDVGIGLLELEVKAGNGRLKGQHGYAAGFAAGKVFSESFNKYMKLLPEDNRITIPDAGGVDYQITKTVARPNILFKHLFDHNVLTRQEAINIWKNAIKAVFLNMDINWIDKHIAENCTITDITAFNKDWLTAATKYYQQQEGFELIFLFNKIGKFILIKQEDFSELWDIIKIESLPSFTSKAGSQGSAFGISIK